MPSTSMRKILLVRGAVLTVAVGALAGCGVADDPLAKVKDPTAREVTAQARTSGTGAQAQLPSIDLGGKNKGNKGEHGGGGNGGGGNGGNGGGYGPHGRRRQRRGGGYLWGRGSIERWARLWQ